MTKEERLQRVAELYAEWVMERAYSKPAGDELNVERAATADDEKAFHDRLVAEGLIESVLR